MHSSTAGNDCDIFEILDCFRCDAALLKKRKSLFDSRHNRCSDSLGLFVDFLNHKVRITALFGSLHIPVGCLKFLFNRIKVFVNERNTVRCKCYDFIMVKKIIIPCVLKNCRNIGRNKALAFCNAYDKRTFTANRKNSVGEILEHNSECKRTLKLSHYAVNCFKRISVVFIVEELSNNLCICVA